MKVNPKDSDAVVEFMKTMDIDTVEAAETLEEVGKEIKRNKPDVFEGVDVLNDFIEDIFDMANILRRV